VTDRKAPQPIVVDDDDEPDSAPLPGAVPDEALLRRKEVCAMLRISRRTLARVIDGDPTFPKFFSLAPGVDVVRARAVRRWISQKELAARTNAQQVAG
jgi:predicted DNA-binding transcriptional regulator AlpA